MNVESELQKAQNIYKENKKLIEKLKRWKRKDLDELFLMRMKPYSRILIVWNAAIAVKIWDLK